MFERCTSAELTFKYLREKVLYWCPCKIRSSALLLNFHNIHLFLQISALLDESRDLEFGLGLHLLYLLVYQAQHLWVESLKLIKHNYINSIFSFHRTASLF